MAIQTLRNPSYLSSLGSNIGQGLGIGLGSGLQALAQSKFNELAQRSQQANLANTLEQLDLSPAEATFVSQLPQNQQLRALFSVLGLKRQHHQEPQAVQESQQMQQPQQEHNFLGDYESFLEAPKSDLLSNPVNLFGSKQSKKQKKEEQLERHKSKKELQQKQALESQLAQQQANQQLAQQEPIQPPVQQPMLTQEQPALPLAQLSAAPPSTALSKEPVEQIKELQAEESPEKVEPSKKEMLKEKKAAEKAAKVEKHAQEKLEKEEKKLAGKELKASEKSNTKESFNVYKTIINEAKSASNNNRRLNRMEELTKKGNLSNPIFGSLVRTLSNGIFGFGIDLNSLLSADSQEFNKLSQDFIKDAKSIFGSRITDADLKSFLLTVPTLSMSADGKLRVINSLRSFNDAALIREKALKEVVEENDGKIPANIDLLIEKKAEAQLNELSNNLNEQQKLINEELKKYGLTPWGNVDITTTEGRKRAGIPWWGIAEERKKVGIPF